MPQPTFRINFVTGASRRHMPEIEALSGLPDRVAALFAGQPAAWARQAPEGEWNPVRVLGHLVAYAQVSRENLDRMSHMTDPIIKRVDDEGENERHHWESQSADRLLAGLAQANGKSVALLTELPDASWGRPGQHPEDGRRSIRQQAFAMAAHFREHIAQIEALRA